MLKIILKNERFVEPFNEPARDLRIVNKPLWLAQRDVLTPYTTQEVEVSMHLPEDRIPENLEALYAYRISSAMSNTSGEAIVLQDNLYFDEQFITAFMEAAKAHGGAVRGGFQH